MNTKGMSKAQLMQMRDSFTSQAIEDAASRLESFMADTHKTSNEVANMFGILPTEVNALLSRSHTVPLYVFATLLIANGNVLCVEPIDVAMRNGFKPNAQAPEVAPRGRSTSSTSATRSRVNAPTSQPRDEYGHFISRSEAAAREAARVDVLNNARTQQMPNPNPYATRNDRNSDETQNSLENMSRTELVDMVVNNGWDNEIDLMRATQPQIISFIESKHVAENGADGEIAAFAAMIQEQLKAHPELTSQLRNLLG